MTLDYFTLRRFDDKLDTIIALLQGLKAKGEVMGAELDALVAQVQQTTTLEQSAITLINGIAEKLKAASNDPAIQAITSELQASATALSAALTANTPAEALAKSGGPAGSAPPPAPAVQQQQQVPTREKAEHDTAECQRQEKSHAESQVRAQASGAPTRPKP